MPKQQTTLLTSLLALTAIFGRTQNGATCRRIKLERRSTPKKHISLFKITKPMQSWPGAKQRTRRKVFTTLGWQNRIRRISGVCCTKGNCVELNGWARFDLAVYAPNFSRSGAAPLFLCVRRRGQLGQGLHQTVNVRFSVYRRQGDAQTRSAVRHSGWANSRYPQSALVQALHRT